MAISRLRGRSSPGRPVQKSVLNQVGFVDILDGSRVFSDGRRQGIKTHGAAVEFLDQRQKKPPVHLIQTAGIYLQKIQRERSHFLIDLSLVLDLGKIPDPF